jgi:hypothetical protein
MNLQLRMYTKDAPQKCYICNADFIPYSTENLGCCFPSGTHTSVSCSNPEAAGARLFEQILSLNKLSCEGSDKKLDMFDEPHTVCVCVWMGYSNSRKQIYHKLFDIHSQTLT